MRKCNSKNCNSCNKNNNSKVGDSYNRNSNNSSTNNSNLNFEKNAGIITDNEYEVTSELSSNKKRKNKRSK